MYKSNNDLSQRSFISDLDLESAEMAPIGESSGEAPKGRKQIEGLGPQHEPNLQDTDGTSSELFVSADFTLASNCNVSRSNSRKSGKSKNSKNSKAGSYGSNNESSGEMFDSSVSIASASVMMDKSRAENVGRSSTKYVYIILLITGIVLSTIVYFTLLQFETNRFELEFLSYARETADLAVTNADHTFSQLETMATAVTSEGMLERERYQESGHYHNASYDDFLKLDVSWPNVTIPHFDERIADFSTSFGAIMLLYVPLVQAKDRESWEYYANVHTPWKTTAISGDVLVDVKSDDYLHIHPCNFLHVDDIREGFNVGPFAEKVLRKGGFESPQGMAAPVYQYGGPGHQRTENSEIALMDLFLHPIFKKDIIASIEYDVPVISEYMDVGFLRGALSTTDPEADASSLWNSEYSVYYNEENNDVNTGKDVIMTLPSIRSLTYHPVKETFESDARTIGFVVGVVPWHTYFRNVLKTSKLKGSNSYDVYEKDEKEVNGMVVKVVSDCGSTFTFVLNSGNTTIETRLGDWKEQYEEYEHLNHTSRFFYKDHKQGDSRHCSFDLNIYPNSDFRDSYRTSNPQIYALVVAGIFLFTALLFACYDRLIFKGQQHIVHEATGMIIANAQRAAKNERELNDFIAHEVRNPLAAAISACSFVSSAIMEDQGRISNENNSSEGEGGETERLALIASAEKRKEVLDDINIIDSSLHFINDLLRNMLDMQRAGSNQIRIERKPTDIMNDIFKPVGAMIHLRDVPFKVILECNSGIQSDDAEEDEQLFVMTDPMRLKQVLLNLTRNATKFVEKGFIRCTAHVNPINGYVELRVDDSGPGIAPEKRSQVFGKFQESLDSLQQGTGIGLSLCKKMIDLMGGSLFIDEDYNSGIDGCPGTRFVIQLKIPPLQLNKMMFEPKLSSIERAKMRRLHISVNAESPEKPSSYGSNLSDSIRSDVTTASKEISFESGLSDSETDRYLQAPATTLSESFLRVAEVIEDAEEAEEKKQGSTMLPLPTALRLNPTGELVPNDSPATMNNPTEQQLDKKVILTELPENLSVLFVDDDMVLRKLFSRTLRKINPTWKCKEASSGETAIELITSASVCKEGFQDEENETSYWDGDDCGFDLIFMDQYMASVQKQLLGTETVRAIRAKGFRKPIICGLSANDVEDAFYHAGADAFMFKPFPCKKDELQKELLKVMNSSVRSR
jgi:signal transduction histidine kinase/CheY-like chemotaxis protein